MENKDSFKKIDVSKEVIKYDPSAYPLLRLLLRPELKDLSKIECQNLMFSWIEDLPTKLTLKIKKIIPRTTKQAIKKSKQISNSEISTRIDNHIQPFINEFSSLSSKNKEAIKHLSAINYAFWHNEGMKRCLTCKSISPTESKRETEGILHLLKDSKVIKLKKNFSKKDFSAFLYKGFTYGDSTKILFVDVKTFDYLTKKIIEKSHLKKLPLNKSYGIKNVVSYISISGDVNIVKEPALTQTMALIDMTCLRYYYYEKEDTHLTIFKNKFFYRTLCGLYLCQRQRHLIAKIN